LWKPQKFIHFQPLDQITARQEASARFLIDYWIMTFEEMALFFKKIQGGIPGMD